VSWVGYNDTTWELANNIPNIKIHEYETKNHNTTSRSGRVRKATQKADFIKTT